jgi:hypothetical protein
MRDVAREILFFGAIITAAACLVAAALGGFVGMFVGRAGLGALSGAGLALVVCALAVAWSWWRA